MRGEVFSYQASGEGSDPSGQRGAFHPLAGCAEGRQRLKGAWANAIFQIKITTRLDHLHKLKNRREVATLGNCPDFRSASLK